MRHFGITWVFLCCATVFAQDSAPPKTEHMAGPMVWSTMIEGFAVHGGESPAVRSIFTPDREIRVVRIEAYDEQGPRLNITGVNTPFVPCSPQPSLTLTDGITTYTQAISSEFLPNSAATYTFSPKLGLTFSAETPIRLIISAPPNKQQAMCMAKTLMVLVHYTTRSD
jgi:hypothetical protein